MASPTPDPNLVQVTFGVFLIVTAVVLLLAALGLLDVDDFGKFLDIFLAFAVLTLGLIYVFGFLNPRH